MTKKFTKLMAAFALLVFMMPSLVAWGQMRETEGFNLSAGGTVPVAANANPATGTINGTTSVWNVTIAGGLTSSSFQGTNGNRYWQMGKSNSSITSAVFSTSDISGTITSIVVKCASAGGQGGSLSATVGGNEFGTQGQTMPAWSNNNGGDVTFNGSASGAIVITEVPASGKACYIQSITVTYTTGGSQLTSTTTTITVPTDFNTDVYTSSTAGQLTATVTYDNSGTPTIVPNATVTWESNNEDVATVDGNGNVTLVAAGTSTITANYAGETGAYAASSATYLLEVISSAPYVQPTTIEANLNNSLFGTDYNGSANGISDSNPVVGTIHNVTVTYAGSGNHYINASQIRFYPNNKLTFEAPEGYEITQIVFTAVSGGTWAATISADNGTYTSNTKTWTGSAASVLFTGSGSSRCDMSKATITLAQLAPKHTLTITMSHVADYTIFIDDETVSGPDPEDPSQTVQVTEGTTVGVSIGGMENCYLFGSLTVNGSTTGVTQDDPDDLYFEFTMPDEDAEIDVTTTDATPYTLTVVGMDNVSFDMFIGYNSTEVTITDGTASICEQMHVMIAYLTADEGLFVQSVTVTDGAGQPVTVTQEGSAYAFDMPSSDATLTITTVAAPTYTLASSIESGKIYIISNGEDRAMGKQNGSIRSAAAVSIEDNIATASSADVYEFEITGSDTEGYTIYDVKDQGYLYASSSSNNNIGTRPENTDANSMWAIAFNGNEVTITAKGDKTRNSLRYNYNNGNERFTCYGSTSNVDATLYLYEKNEPATETYTLTIDGYNDGGGWNLIASPVAVNPVDVEGMTIENSEDPNYSNFDLYYFDQTGGQNGKEWKNYKASHFDLELGKGYLYANANTVDLAFTGIENGDFTDVDLPYVQGNTIQSLYLAGNSKTTAETFYVYDGSLEKQTVNILTINGTGDGFTTTTKNSFTAQALQGFFVQSGGQNWTLSTADMDAKSGTPELLNVMVSQNRGGLVDNAIVSFGNAPLMSKFYLTDNSTRIFIPQNGEEMAVVRSEAQGEMPVNFKAKENGTYTLSIDAENVEMNYLHLIDNMTGMDIDLLQTPSYTFEANTNDYVNRFKLVFAANGTDEADEASFAFFSDGNLIVNNEGNATLQVIDVNGRILSSETISGSCSKAINATTGVYMLRLINGDNVKVQKVVVR